MASASPRLAGSLGPRRVVVADGVGEQRQVGERLHELEGALAVRLLVHLGVVRDQSAVLGGGRDSHIMQQPGEDKILQACFGQAEQQRRLAGDHGNALAVLEIADADQVEGVRDGKHGTLQVDRDGHRTLGRAANKTSIPSPLAAEVTFKGNGSQVIMRRCGTSRSIVASTGAKSVSGSDCGSDQFVFRQRPAVCHRPLPFRTPVR